MRNRVIRRVLGIALLGAAVCAHAEGDEVFLVEFSNPLLIPAHWTLEFHRDGTGHFQSVRGMAPSREIEPPNVDRDVQLSAQFAEHVFELAERKKLFRNGCDSHLKVAFQGLKKFSYAGRAGQGSCEFNYSRDAEIQELGDSLVSVANTLIEGERLQMLLLHDRLGLDRETETLMESAADGRAKQIGSIRDILERLEEDPAVLDRVKRRARILLAKADNGA
ncbi:MAG TPA: hypothetical protein VG267_09165 [Terracidiphilus sp.]|jgi:hypothetical protein|nr:hypothetical protein [Terracidiphilus sp.]